METAETKLLVTVPEFAELIGVSRTTAWKMVYDGELRSITIGRSRRIELDEVKRWIAQKVEATA